jgi:glutathione S-transferase
MLVLTTQWLAYKTVWVEYPDIKDLCARLGAKPTSFMSDGTGTKYPTLPVIHDGRTNAVVSDTIDIALYLDEAYPDTPPVFPKGTKTLQLGFITAFRLKLDVIYIPIMPLVYPMLNEASKPFFRQSREALFGMKFEDFSPVGPVRDEQWKAVKGALDVADRWLAKGDSDQAYIIGESPSFADFVIAARFLWIKLVLGEDSQLWKDVSSWNGGRWNSILKSMERYETVV